MSRALVAAAFLLAGGAQAQSVEETAPSAPVLQSPAVDAPVSSPPPNPERAALVRNVAYCSVAITYDVYQAREHNNVNAQKDAQEKAIKLHEVMGGNGIGKSEMDPYARPLLADVSVAYTNGNAKEIQKQLQEPRKACETIFAPPPPKNEETSQPQ